ncbi:hypothetical protein T492DRAFT_510315 [Pavlovales sp. CCMP2436]|nr:hypothetical protein T492DRAFT_510315 [Pavlovales sp. CCMP2436]
MAVEKTRVSGRARLPLLIALLGVQSGAAFSAAFPSPSLAAAARASSSAGLSRPLAAFPQRRAGGVRLSSLDDDADASTNADSLLATASAMAELAASSGGGALTQIDVCDEMQVRSPPPPHHHQWWSRSSGAADDLLERRIHL